MAKNLIAFLERRIKKELLQHFRSLGFVQDSQGRYIPPGNDKEVLRGLHGIKRIELLQSQSDFIIRRWPKLSCFFADGADIDPKRIMPCLELIKADTWQSDLFRLASLTWSVPVSPGYGRRMRFLVWDEFNSKLVGLIALDDPVFNLKARDDFIGWDSQVRRERLVNVMDAYVLGAIPPYSHLLAGKMVACLIRTVEVINLFSERYATSCGIISNRVKNANLALVTTTSALGRSSVYNRLKLDGRTYFESIGYTSGWGHFHIPDHLFALIREYLTLSEDSYASNYKFGSGPNWRLRAIRKCFSMLGLDQNLLKHGICREVFLCHLASNAIAFLQGRQPEAKYEQLLSVADVAEQAKNRWIIPRAKRRPEYHLKYLISELYRDEPKSKAGLPVGTLVFDAEGEYFWPDAVSHRPGFCDVPHLRDKLMVFTSRQAPNAYYGSWKAGGIKLDIRQLKPRDVIGIAIAPDKQTNQNVLKLKALSEDNWSKMVDLIVEKQLQATDQEVGLLLGYRGRQITDNVAEISAARSNMFNIVRLLHDPSSSLLVGVRKGLAEGMVVVVDISLLSSAAGEIVAGLLLRNIFSHNQENFTGGEAIIPTVAIIEEAQSVLGRYLDENSPFVEWVKEGRKYDLGAILVTQQPGSMSPELMSQADNWFCFHLLSEGDAGTLGKYNSHFSDDVLAHLISEPIAGNCYMWSAPNQPFVLPVRIKNFEDLYGSNIMIGEQDSVSTKALEIKKNINELYSRLSEAIIPKLLDSRKKFYKIEGRVGIYHGHLYYIIKDIKDPNDVISENQAMLPLLNFLLGEGNVTLINFAGKEFYCATLECWANALGKTPTIYDVQA